MKKNEFLRNFCCFFYFAFFFITKRWKDPLDGFDSCCKFSKTTNTKKKSEPKEKRFILRYAKMRNKKEISMMLKKLLFFGAFLWCWGIFYPNSIFVLCSKIPIMSHVVLLFNRKQFFKTPKMHEKKLILFNFISMNSWR